MLEDTNSLDGAHLFYREKHLVILCNYANDFGS